ncbi:hypothetical protein E2320_002337, partial [Naja naja]
MSTSQVLGESGSPFIPEIPYNVLAIIKLTKVQMNEVSFKIKVANQKFVQVVGKGDVHIPGLGRIKEVLFIPEIPYNVLAIIKLTKGTDEYSSDDSSEKNIPTENIPRRSLRTNKGKIPNTLGDY